MSFGTETVVTRLEKSTSTANGQLEASTASYQHKDAGLRPFAREVRDALKTGKAIKRKEAGKFIYMKDLR
jgi:hypothetical protein